jgi:hypothetical protein
VTAAAWNDVLTRLGQAASLAKRFNVTLALRNQPNSFAAGTHDMKRVTKETDSAWVRYGPDFDTLEEGSDPNELLPKAVLAWLDYASADSAADLVRGMLRAYRGFLVLDAAQGDANVVGMKAVVDRIWRLSHEV